MSLNMQQHKQCDYATYETNKQKMINFLKTHMGMIRTCKICTFYSNLRLNI